MPMTAEDIAMRRTILFTSRDRLQELTSQLFKKGSGLTQFFLNQGSIEKQHETICIFAALVERLYLVLESPEEIADADIIDGSLDRVLSEDIDVIGGRCVSFFQNYLVEKKEAMDLKEVIAELFNEAKQEFYLMICASESAVDIEAIASLRIELM